MWVHVILVVWFVVIMCQIDTYNAKPLTDPNISKCKSKHSCDNAYTNSTTQQTQQEAQEAYRHVSIRDCYLINQGRGMLGSGTKRPRLISLRKKTAIGAKSASSHGSEVHPSVTCKTGVGSRAFHSLQTYRCVCS